jgi:hypothetical protein
MWGTREESYMKKVLFTLGALAMAVVAAWAQTGIAAPQMGFIQDGGNSLRPVYGIAGNFVLGDATASGVVCSAFSGSFGLVKTDSSIVAMDGQGQVLDTADAPPGSALFGFSRSGAPALAYLASTNLLLQWTGATFEPVLLAPNIPDSADVVSIASPVPGQAAMILQRGDDLWDVRILLATGELISQTAILGVTAPVLTLPTGDLVYGDANGLVVRQADGSEKHIAGQLPESFALRQMGDGWIQVRDLDTGHQFAVRITANREQFYGLPGTDQ